MRPRLCRGDPGAGAGVTMRPREPGGGVGLEVELWWEVWGCQVRPRGLGYMLGLYPKNIRSEAFEGHGEGGFDWICISSS